LSMTIRICTLVFMLGVGGVLAVTSAALLVQLFNEVAKRPAAGANLPPDRFPEPVEPVNPGNPTNPGMSDGTAGAVGIGVLLAFGCFGLVVGGLLFTCYVLDVVGYARWLSVPASAGGYGLAMTTLLCALAPIAIGVLSVGAGALPADVGQLVSQLLGLVNLAATITGFVCGLLFIRQVGVALDDAPTRSAVLSDVIWIGVFIAAAVSSVCLAMGGAMVMGAMAFNSSQSGGSAAGIGAVGVAALATIALVNFILWIMVIVKYYGMLNAAIRAIDARAAAA